MILYKTLLSTGRSQEGLTLSDFFATHGHGTLISLMKQFVQQTDLVDGTNFHNLNSYLMTSQLKYLGAVLCPALAINLSLRPKSE